MLKGKTALITGGGTGIGRATAQRFAEEGADVWIVGIDEPSLVETQLLIGASCRYAVCDVRDGECMSAMINSLDRLDVLVSNAAVSVTTPLLHESLSQWRDLTDINQWGSVSTCLLAGERMIRDGGGGRIILVASILGNLAEAGSGAYGIGKAALQQFSRQLAVEWAAHGILVNTVNPGTILTPMSMVSGHNEYESEWFQRFFVAPERPRIPLQRPGAPEEVAEVMLFLANPRNSYFTGQTLTVDGGLTITF